MKFFYDYEKDSFMSPLTDNLAMDYNGDTVMRINDFLALDLDSGDMHIISGWLDDDD